MTSTDGNSMITVTRRNGTGFALNPDLIERVEATPDTVITLVSGTKYVVSETVEQIGNLFVEVIAAPEAARAQLRLEVGSFVYHIVRVRYLDGKPLILEKSYMPVTLLPNLRQQHAEQSIFSFVRDELHLRIQSAHRIVRVRGADALEAAELHLASGAPVAVVQETYFLASGVPFNYSIATHEPEHFALETVLVD